MKAVMTGKFGLLLVCLLLITACDSIHFYTQAIGGQFNILAHRKSIIKILEDRDTPPELKNKLEVILEIREFAEQELALPVEKNYSSYVDLQRPYVVWNVFAAPEFSLQPVTWCYPVAGCASYRGYFREGNARDFGRALLEKGFDVYIGPVAAYSTLGWFSDPVLNTIVNREDYRLASLIFHELAHQVVYVPGDTEFNESFATTVELEGLRRWLDAKANDSKEAKSVLEKAEMQKQRRQEFVALVRQYSDRLKGLYASEIESTIMRERKQAILTELKEAYQKMKINWDGYDVYDGWFNQEINNAQLSTVGTYFNQVPAFQRVLASMNNNMTQFYEEVITLSKLDDEERQQSLVSFSNKTL